jgi:hypothetical protein
MAKQKLGNPAFIAAVFILILNDWYLKQTFHNDLTGKMSDFAGLFAFPFLLAALLPRKVTGVYVLTFLLFILWKSVFIQPLIDGLNALGIPVHRTVDYSDYIALLVLPFSHYIFNRSTAYSLKPALLNTTVVIASVSFMATTMPPGTYTTFNDVNKTYTFNCSKRELVSRINTLQIDYVHDINKSVNDANKLYNGTMHSDTGRIDFDSKNNIFYYTSSFSKKKKDTIAMLIDYEKVKDTDTITLRTMYADLNISGDNTTSQIKILSLRNYVRKSEKGDHKDNAVKIFQKFVIKKIRKG